jgi:hypothetical protein
LLSALCPLAVLHEHGDANHGDAKAIRKRATGIAAHHAPDLVVIYELAEEARARQPLEGAEVDRGLGVPAAREHAARSGAQGHHVAWARKVVRLDG